MSEVASHGPSRGSAGSAPRTGAPADGAFVGGALTIRGQEVPTRTGDILQTGLRYFVENPRVYSLLHGDGRAPTQDEIERTLQGMEHVKELVQDIRDNGGLVDPLVVRDGTLDVVEGNSRLAAYRALAKTNPIKWARVRCTLLPADVAPALVSALLGQWHLKGKKEWLPYEQAGYLYRRHAEQGTGLDELAAEVGIGRQKVARLVEVYAFMVAHGDRKRDRWSYYDELLKSRKIAKVREAHPGFDALVVGKIQSGEIRRAEDVRDLLPVVCESKPRVLQKFLSGAATLEEAHERAVEAGGDHTPYQRLAKFRKWLAQPDVLDALAGADGQVRTHVAFEVKQLQRLLAGLAKKTGA